MSQDRPESNIYDRDLDRNPANHQALTPLTFLDWSASVYPDKTAVIHGSTRYTYREGEDHSVDPVEEVATAASAAELPGRDLQLSCPVGVISAQQVVDVVDEQGFLESVDGEYGNPPTPHRDTHPILPIPLIAREFARNHFARMIELEARRQRRR